MASLGTLTLDLIARTSGFVAGMSKAERSSAKWRRKVKSDVKDVSRALATGLKVGAVAAAAGLTLMVNRSRQVIDEQAKMAARLNTSSKSLATLGRAADRTGLSMRVIETAARTLDINLGRAAQGSKLQAEALDRLSLSAEDLSKLPLDQRITEINNALRDNVPAFERAAVAADLFGSRGAAAVRQLDPETIALAAEEAEVLGLALSEVDAAKVENANDSFSRISAAATGLSQQLTIELAPAIDLIGERFFASAEAAGGVGNEVRETVDQVAGGIAFLANAADGFGRVVRLAVNNAILAVRGFGRAATGIAAQVLETYNKLPFLDLTEELAGFARSIAFQNAAINEILADQRDLLEAPLAGDSYLNDLKRIREESEAAAEAAVAARKALQGGKGNDLIDDPAATDTVKPDPVGDTLKDLEKQAALLGKSEDFIADYELRLAGATATQLEYAAALRSTIGAFEAQQLAEEEAAEARDALNDEARSIAESLRTEEERIKESYARRKDIVLRNTEITGQARQNLLLRLEKETNDQLGELNATFWENYVKQAEASLKSLDEIAANTITGFANDFGSVVESIVFDAKSADEALYELVSGFARASINALGELAAQWLVYQAVQLTSGKTAQAAAAATIGANAVAQQQLAALNAFASTAAIPITGPALAPAAAAAALAATTPFVVGASSAALAGVAHDGLMSVPTTGTYLLERGERVTTQDTSAKLDGMIDEARNGGGGNVRIVNAWDTALIGDYVGSSEGERVVMNVVRKNQRTIRSLAQA